MALFCCCFCERWLRSFCRSFAPPLKAQGAHRLTLFHAAPLRSSFPPPPAVPSAPLINPPVLSLDTLVSCQRDYDAVGFVDRLRLPPARGSSAKRSSVRPTNKQRIKSRLDNLTLDVSALRLEVQRLTRHTSLLHTRALYSPANDDGSAAKRVAEYFAMFRRGYRSSERRQVAFLKSFMDPDCFSLGVTGLGVDAFMRQFRYYTGFFALRFLTDQRCVSWRATWRTRRASSARTRASTTRSRGTHCKWCSTGPALDRAAPGQGDGAACGVSLAFNSAGRLFRHDFEGDFSQRLQRHWGIRSELQECSKTRT